MEDTFDSRQAARLSGLTLTMLDYLCRSGVVTPSSSAPRGRGRKRLYTFTDVVILRGVSKLLAAGVGVSRLAKALRRLKSRYPDLATDLSPGSYIVTDGRDLYVRCSDQVLESLATGQLAFGFVIEVGRLREEVVSELDRMKLVS